MRRWTVRVLCWLALGASVDVTVAWGFVDTRLLCTIFGEG